MAGTDSEHDARFEIEYDTTAPVRSPAAQARMALARRLLRARNRVLGLDLYRDPLSYFGPGGLDEAAAVCAEANRDLKAFVRPVGEVTARGARVDGAQRRRDGVRVEHWSFDSPLPSGDVYNDRVRLRLFRPPAAPPDAGVVLFHHAVYGKRWALWSWFLEELIRRVPVAIMAGPYHYERTGPGRFPGEGTINPNPARLYESLRQWCWDHHAAAAALRESAGLGVVAEIGYSLGAFQTLLLASAGEIDVPVVSLASTNRYAWGLTHGVIGRGLRAAMQRAGVDGRRLYELTHAIQLERHVTCLRGRPVLYIRGSRDLVDPPPSLDRLERALRPTRSVTLTTGHAGLVLRRRRVFREVRHFLEETGALRVRSRRPDGETEPRTSP